MQWVTDHNVSVRGRLCICSRPWCRCGDNIRRVFVLAGVLVFDGGLYFGPVVLVVVHLGLYVCTFLDSRCACRFSGLKLCVAMALSRVASLSFDIHYA